MNSNDLNENEIESAKKKPPPYPKSIIFIIGNEFCERFSYYGMRTILVLYFKYILMYSDDTATQAFHIFAMACYFTPVFGAIIADSYLGKFMTIFTISIVYAAGNILLSFSAMHGTAGLSLTGLALIAIGTGGIKPCVSAFGGDQFLPEQKSQLQKFFSLFYMSINAGSLISTFITPILRQDVSCGGRSDCYPLAFGIPAILMIVSLVLFILGKYITHYIIVPPQKDNIVFTVVKCVCHAIARKCSPSSPKKSHWVEYADDKFDAKTISEVKILMGILFLYIPLPIFWALFDQQSSRWTLQAVRMNGQLGNFTIKPDQIQVINPVLVIAFIPIFDYAIYPFLNKIGLGKPLRRMTCGGILAAVAFLICGFFQLRIETEQPNDMIQNHNHFALMNSLDCPLTFENSVLNATIPSHGSFVIENVDRATLSNFNGTFICNGNPYEVTESVSDLKDEDSLIILITEKLFQNKIDSAVVGNFFTKSDEGGAKIFTVFNLKNFNQATDEFSVSLTNDDIKNHTTILNSDSTDTFGFIKNFEVEVIGKDITMSVGKHDSSLSLLQGATYIQMIFGDMKTNVRFVTTKIVEQNELSVFLQLIQYLVITAGEIMFSITGLQFSYSQAPSSMKSVLQAAWLLTVAFGNLLVAIIADLKIFKWQSYEFFFFGILMLVDMGIFSIMAYFYKPSKISEEEDVKDDLAMNSIDEKKPQN